MSSEAITRLPSSTAASPMAAAAQRCTKSVSFAWFTTAGQEPPSISSRASARKARA